MPSPNFIPPARRGLMAVGQPPPMPTSAPGGVGQFDMPPAEEAMTEGEQGPPAPFAGGTYNPQAASSALNAAFANRPATAWDPTQSEFLAHRAGQPTDSTANVDNMFPYEGADENIATRQAMVRRANPQWAFDAETENENRRFADPGQTAARQSNMADVLRKIHEQYSAPESIRAQGVVDAATAHATGESDSARIKAEGAAATATGKADAAQKIAAHMAEVIISRGTPDETTGELRPLNDQERAQVYREAGVNNPAGAPGVPGGNVLTQQHIDQYIAAHPGATTQQAIDAAKTLGYTIR